MRVLRWSEDGDAYADSVVVILYSCQLLVPRQQSIYRIVLTSGNLNCS